MTDVIATPAPLPTTPVPAVVVAPAPTVAAPAPAADPAPPCPTCHGSGKASPMMRPCQHCGTAIAIGKDGRRSNSRYCNDTCRQNGYRNRKKAAS